MLVHVYNPWNGCGSIDLYSAKPRGQERVGRAEARAGRMVTTHRRAWVVALMLTAAGCGGGSTPSSPSAAEAPVSSPVGNWSGSMSDPVSGNGTLRLSLEERPPTPFSSAGSLGGNWSVTFRSGDSVSGFASAVVIQTGAYGVVLFADPPPPCATGAGSGGSTLVGFTMINVVVTSRRMTAVSARNTCSLVAPNFGSIDLARQ